MRFITLLIACTRSGIYLGRFYSVPYSFVDWHWRDYRWREKENISCFCGGTIAKWTLYYRLRKHHSRWTLHWTLPLLDCLPCKRPANDTVTALRGMSCTISFPTEILWALPTTHWLHLRPLVNQIAAKKADHHLQPASPPSLQVFALFILVRLPVDYIKIFGIQSRQPL